MSEPLSRPEQPRPSWRDRLAVLRDSLLGAPGFHRFAARFPLTRFVARRRARALFDLTAGFVYSQTVFALVELGLLERLRAGPQAAAALAADSDVPTARLRHLLDAAVGLGLLERRTGGTRYGLGAGGAAMLGNPGVAAMVRHHAMLYADLADPVALLRDGSTARLRSYWAYADGTDAGGPGQDSVSAYSGLMATSNALVADDILDAYPVARHRHLLDVGGGEGVFLIAAARRAPALALTLFDLPAVMAGAERRIGAAGLEGRIARAPGSFLADAIPQGPDLVSLVRVLHDHDDDVALALLRNIRAALPAGGVVLVAEPMAGTPGAESVGAYFEWYLLAMGSGRPRTAGEVSALLRRAGFARVRTLRTNRPVLTSVVTAACEVV